MAGKLGIASFLVLSAAAFAHHAYTAEFDTTKPIKKAAFAETPPPPPSGSSATRTEIWPTV